MEKQDNYNRIIALNKFLGILIICISFHSPTISQSTYTSRIYNAYLEGDMQEWLSIIEQMEDESKSADDIELLYELGVLKYGYIAYCIGNERKDEAEDYIDSVLDDIEYMNEMDPEFGKQYSLKGAINGFRIKLNPFKAIYLGPRSMKDIERAIDLDPESAPAWLEMANSEYYRPSVFGGDKVKAIETYKKSIQYFEKDSLQNKECWHYLSAMITLAKAYELTDQALLALKQYEKILSVAPDFVWVRDELYPDLVKKIQY